MDYAVVDMGLRGLVSHQIGAAQQFKAPLQEHLRANARHGGGQGACENHLGRDSLPDSAGNGCVLQAEHLRQDHRIFIFEQDADFLYDDIPDAVHGAGDLDGAHFAGAFLQPFELWQVQLLDPACHALFFQAFGQEGRKEVVIAHEIDDQDTLAELLGREQADVFQRKGSRSEGTQRHQPDARAVVDPDTGFREQVADRFGGLFQGFKATGKEVQGILPVADDGCMLSGFLQADAGHQAGQSSADDDSIESHNPRTCL